MAEGYGRHVCDKVKKQPGAREGCCTNGADGDYQSLKGAHRLAGFHLVINIFI